MSNYNYLELDDNTRFEKNVKEIFLFLKKVHHYNTEDKKAFIEVRKVQRDVRDKNEFLFLNHFDEDDYMNLKKFLHRIASNQTFNPCLYWGTFSSKQNKNFGTTDSAYATNALVADFDDITYEEFNEYHQLIKDIGFEPIVVSSGKGYQVLFLLDEACYDKKIHKKFTELLIRKGFAVDKKIKDAARLFRLPNTANNKYFSVEKVSYPAKVIRDSEKRYNIDFIFDVFEFLDDVVEVEKTPAHISIEETLDISEIDQENLGSFKEGIFDLKEMYGYNTANKLPIPILKMLAGQEEGSRNEVLTYLTYFLNRRTKISQEEIVKMLLTWGQNCTPPLPEEYVISNYKRLSKYRFIQYTTELASKYGYISQFVTNKVVISGNFFEHPERFKTNSLKLYISLLLKRANSSQKEFTTQDLAEISGLKKDSLISSKKILVQNQILSKKKRSSPSEQDKYYFTPYFKTGGSFLYLPVIAIEELNKLRNNEIAVMLLIFKNLNAIEESKVSLRVHIANKLNLTPQAISPILNSLTEKNQLLRRTEIYRDSFIKNFYQPKN